MRSGDFRGEGSYCNGRCVMRTKLLNVSWYAIVTILVARAQYCHYFSSTGTVLFKVCGGLHGKLSLCK